MKKPCKRSRIDASEALALANVNTDCSVERACDGNTDSFYHSIEDNIKDPFFKLSLGGSFMIKKITVVNVHKGGHCNKNPSDCTSRLNGSLVEVISGF